MRILISQRDFRIPPSNFLYDCLERSWYSFLSGHHLIPVANTGVVPDTEYDCLVLSGGSDSLARNYTENTLFYHAIKNKKPILGVCHGAFAVNELTGGINDLEPSLIPKHDDTQHEIVMEGNKVLVNSYHGQTIKTLGKGMIPIAMHEADQTIEAFRHEHLPIFGIVWHPERMSDPIVPTCVADLIK